MDLQFYSEKVVVENEANASLVTVSKVDLAEIVAQVNIGDLLEHMEYGDVIDYYSLQGDE